MIVNKIVLIFILKIIKIKANTDSLCVISSDYVPNLLSNLVFEYKFSELQSTKVTLTEIKENLDKFRDVWTEAIAETSNYDECMYKFYYITEKISNNADNAVKTLDLVSAKSDDQRVIIVANFIDHYNNEKAMEAYLSLGNEGLLFTIVEIVYNKVPKSYTESIKKLIAFTIVLLKKKRIKPVATISLALLREMIKSKNIFTFDMMYFAEFINLKYQELNREYFHIAEYAMLKEQFIYMEKSLPTLVQDTVFGHSFHPSDYVYLKNVLWNEHLFVDNFFHGNIKERRIAYTWEIGIPKDKMKWRIKFDMDKVGYLIVSRDYDEYLYATDNSLLYNSSNRPIFTRRTYGSIEKGVWLIEPVDNTYFFIRNKYYDEYIYVPEDETFADTYTKRRVFSYTSKENTLVPQEHGNFWIIEKG